jgi:DNA (cytosine-5)-methyltransferase 1
MKIFLTNCHNENRKETIACAAGILLSAWEKLTQHDSERDMGQKKPLFAQWREFAGLTLDEAMAQLEISRTTAYRYERGTSTPSRLAIRTLKELAQQRSNQDSAPSFRFIDLFAGIGGLRLGFESIGGRCVFTSEWDTNSQKTYALNFPNEHPISGDIREFSKDPDLIPEHDVLLAGFPCQPFSIAGVSKKNALGRPHGFLCDTQGTLFFDTAQIIAHRRPPVFVLENVKNLERHDGGKTFATIMNVLENELGYYVRHKVISSAHWVPQKRERVFIVGFKRRIPFDFRKIQIPDRDNRPTLGDILDPPEKVDPKYTLTAHLWKYLQDYKAKHEAKGNGFGYGLFGPNDVARTLSARYYKDGSEILIRQTGNRPRRLTPRECARLMGFETKNRHWRIEVSDTQAYRQFGNAVVVQVVEFVAQHLAPHIAQAVELERQEKAKSVPTPSRRKAANG